MQLPCSRQSWAAQLSALAQLPQQAAVARRSPCRSSGLQTQLLALQALRPPACQAQLQPLLLVSAPLQPQKALPLSQLCWSPPGLSCRSLLLLSLQRL